MYILVWMNQVPHVFLWILRHSLSFAQDIVFCMCRMDHLYGQLMLSPFTDQRYSARSSTQPLQCPNWKSSWTLLCPSLKWTQRERTESDLWCFGNIWIIGTTVGLSEAIHSETSGYMHVGIRIWRIFGFFPIIHWCILLCFQKIWRILFMRMCIVWA